MLHTPDYGKARPFCGPTAIAAITGASFEKIYKMIRRYRTEREKWTYLYNRISGSKPYRGPLKGGRILDLRGRKIPIRGMGQVELVKVMQRLGYKATGHPGEGMTLRALCEDRGHMGPFIVNVTGHYIAVSHGMICDTHTKVPIPIAEYKKLGWRVKRFWLFKATKKAPLVSDASA